MLALADPVRRLALGQWFTPVEVADLALALALPGASERGALRILDPSCGDGAFLSRAAAAGVGGLFGVELDAAAAAAARAAVPGAEVRCADLFSLAAEEIAGEGFDAVVGNPPYVRQERLGRRQKHSIERRLAADWPDLPVEGRRQLVGRADLAASVVARALRLCRPGGRVAMVVSSALLDAGYADPLWRLIERQGRVVALVEAPSERWFRDAAVNALILLIERRSEGDGAASSPVLVARLRVPTAEAARSVGGLADLGSVAELREAPAGSPRAWVEAVRAPAAWFELAQAAGSRLVPLGSIAEVRRGVTSGANGFFYLSRERAAALGVESEVLAPLLRSPREPGGETVAVDPSALTTLALLAPAGEEALARFPVARRYILEHTAASARPTLAARSSWWALPVRTARLFLTKAYAARFVQRLSPEPVVADQRLYSLHPREGVDLLGLAAVLNSTFTALALESLGRASLGEGALEWTVADAARLPVLDPRLVPGEAAEALAALARRAVGSVHAERHQVDREALDRAVGGPLGALLPRLHDALTASVARRAARATSR